MVKTDKLWINGNVYRNDEADELLEAFSKPAAIQGREFQHLRLLTEETMGMAHQLLKNFEGELWIEETTSGYEIILEAAISANRSQAADPEDAPAGFMPKIAELLNCSYIFESREEVPEALAAALPDYMSYGFSCSDDSGKAWAGKWSLSAYRQNLKSHPGTDPVLDELEKSIVAQLADEVTVGISGRRIRMVITVRI